MRMHRTASLAALIAAAAACQLNGPDTETIAEDIYSGTETDDYPEAVIIDVWKSNNTWGRYCTGVALAPSVVLTVAHCFVVEKTNQLYSKFRVFVPATGQSIETSNKIAYPDYKLVDEDTGPNTGYDIGLLLLPTKIKLSSFPHLSALFTGPGDVVRAVGRVSKGALSASNVYVSRERRLSQLWDSNSRYYLFSEATQEKGDSGGPVIRLDRSRHTVVAILAAGNDKASVATRLDTVYDWIVTQIQRYTASHTSLAPSCGSGFACELSAIGGGFPCSAGNVMAYCCDTIGQAIENGHCVKAQDQPPPGGGQGSGSLPPTSAPGVVMWDVAGHVRDQNMAPVPGVVVQVWGIGEAGYRKHFDSTTDAAGNWKVGGFIVKGGEYDVILAPNQAGQGFAVPNGPRYKYPAFTSWLSHTRDQSTSKDTPLGSISYLHQKAGSDDCAGPDTTRSGNKRCDFMYTTDGNRAHLYPPPPAGVRVTCDLTTTPSKPRATVWWNAEPRATLGYYVRVDHRPSSFDTTACTGGAGSTGRVDAFDRCVDGTTHTSLTVGPIEVGAPYYAWVQSGSVEGSFSTTSSAISFHCP